MDPYEMRKQLRPPNPDDFGPNDPMYEAELALYLHELEQLEVAEKLADAQREPRVRERLEELRARHEANRRHVEELTRQQRAALPKAGWTAADFLKESDAPLVQVVQGLHYRGNNTLLSSEQKVGKTTMMLNLAISLADGSPFLGRYNVQFEEGRVAMLNYEMVPRQFREWIRTMGCEHPERIIPVNLRGSALPFWEPDEMARLSDWFRESDVRFIIIDPAVRAMRGLVEHEADNLQLAQFNGALDELKRRANCPNLLMSSHSPRRDGSRARGGSEIEAWPDGLWNISKVQGGVRVFSAEGRDVLVPETALDYDPDTLRFTATGIDPKTKQDAETDRELVEIVKLYGPIEAKTELGRRTGWSDKKLDRSIARCRAAGTLLVEGDGEAGIANVYRVAGGH